MNEILIPVVDLFAGPGGLGEGFSAPRHDETGSKSPFTIVASVEKEKSARQTLLVRSYYRQLVARNLPLENYYAWFNRGSGLPQPQTEGEVEAMKLAEAHAVLHELGSDPDDDKSLEKFFVKRLREYKLADKAVLIGGPPCQAYSLAGRSRNIGTKSYSARDDHRHFLYKEYLRILNLTKPAVFIMENVPGILSSKIDGNLIFPSILQDLAAPYRVMEKSRGKKYRIHSLVTDDVFADGDDPALVNGRNFVIKSEEYGIPQKRHRVILLGVRDDIQLTPSRLEKATEKVCLADVIYDLPKLRSKLSKGHDSNLSWAEKILEAGDKLEDILGKSKRYPEILGVLKKEFPKSWGKKLSAGALRFSPKGRSKSSIPAPMQTWYLDPNLEVVPNHEARGHIFGDLERYLFSSCFARAYGKTPKADDYPDELSPCHENWGSKKFTDRFRTQIAGVPATTVTSHISKDGNYYIHPDPAQCRTLTVREAARLQTFPDNYFFMGNRTEQYVQVGNAVPPLLASKIAGIVFDLISKHCSDMEDPL